MLNGTLVGLPPCQAVRLAGQLPCQTSACAPWDCFNLARMRSAFVDHCTPADPQVMDLVAPEIDPVK